MSLTANVARALEGGRGGPLSSAVSGVWGAVAARTLVKALRFEANRRVIVIGGATLGGSGKTPLAIACAKYLASIGESAAFVGHAYGASPDGPRAVAPRDHISRVGDEALVAARELAASGVAVCVAPSRQAALDLALARARIAVVDGVAQIGPTRAHLALLATDAESPWGSGACPPRGDLRAPRRALVSVCDRIVAIGSDATLSHDLSSFDRPIHQVRTTSAGAWLDGSRLTWDELRRRRIGLWTSIARPARVIEQLAREGVIPRVVAAHADHATISTAETTVRAQRAFAERVDLWLCTPKCAVHLPPHLERVRLAILDYELTLGEGLRRALRDAVHG